VVPSYRQLTYRRGSVESARFSPDGHGVYYTAAWEGRASAAFAMRLDGHEARDLGLATRRIVSILPGEMAFLRGEGMATLARVPLEGGAPRDEQAGVVEADWSGDGRRLALVRRKGEGTRLEFPSGRVVYESAGRLITPRVSPDGRAVAVVDQSMLGNTPGSLVLVEEGGRARRLSEGWADIGGVAWHPSGLEIWFTAARAGSARALHAVSTSGRYRLVARTPGSMNLQDISPAGGVLFTNGMPRTEVYGRLRGDTAERDLSWFDWTHATELLPDGRGLFFTAEGEGGGPLYSLYLRRDPEAAPVRLAEGHGTEVSPDGAWALAVVRSAPPRLQLLPTGPGEPRVLAAQLAVAEHHWAWWLPDGRRVLFLANAHGSPAQLFLMDLPDGAPRAIAPPGVTAYRHKPLTPDGRRVLAMDPGPPGRFVAWPLDGGDPSPVPGLAIDDQPLRWSDDGAFLFVRPPGPVIPLRIERLHVATGRREPWQEWRPADPAGVVHIGDVLVSGDGRSFAVNCQRTISDLYLAQGLR
jgi:eukaryotic-like serine/threonine-protein kinase